MTAAIPPLPLEAIDPALADKLRPIVDRVGYFGAFFAHAGHAPRVLSSFLDYTATLKAHLSDRHNEVIALTVCARYRSPYERIQHERLAARLGFPLAWIAELIGEGAPGSGGLTDDERALQALALAVLDRNGEDVGAELAEAGRFLDPAMLVAALHQIVRLQGICIIANALALAAPAASPLHS